MYCVYRDTREENFVDVDLTMARNVFKKLTAVKWISPLVTATIYLAYLRYSTIAFLYRNNIIVAQFWREVGGKDLWIGLSRGLVSIMKVL